MTPTPSDLYGIARIMADLAPEGILESISAPFRPFAAYLWGLSAADRPHALEAYLYAPGLPRDRIIAGLAALDPTGEPPCDEPVRSAHLGDLVASVASSRFVWTNWLVRGHFNLLSSDPKIGKTHLTLELARRLWFALEWPDGQPPSFPARTVTLWVCGDRHQDELRERARAFGLPDEAVRLNARPENPYGGWDLDEDSNRELLRELVVAEKPGLVVIDTVWRATRRQLRREEEANALMDPIVSIAQETNTAILGLMHLSKDGETLGRRLEGLARAIMKMTRPDPAGQPNRRHLCVIGNFKEPPPLGVTLKDAGCDFDFEPPTASLSAKPKGGRPPAKLEKATTFLIEQLAAGPQKVCELISEWEAMGEAKGTLYNAKETMVADGRLQTLEEDKPKRWSLISHPSETVINPVPDRF